MNSINFYTGAKFPLYRDALAKIQDAVNIVAKLTGIAGQNFILSGCSSAQDGSVQDGIVVINGELLPFSGGIPKPRITIQETRQPVTAFDVVYPEVYITRVACFSDVGEYIWSDFSRIKTNDELYRMIRDISGDAPGIIKMWSGLVSKIPQDYMLCDGSELQITAYQELYENIGVAFGGNGQNVFNIPDLRGRFVVGFDSSNPDYNAINRDKTGGSREVVLEKKHLPRHNHRNPSDGVFNKLSARSADVDATNTPSGTDSISSDSEYRVAGMTNGQWLQAEIKEVGEDVAHENRPPYFTLAYIIKVR